MGTLLRHRDLFAQYREKILETIFPRTCICCGRLLGSAVKGFTCLDCRKGYVRIAPPYCRCCGKPFGPGWTGVEVCRDCEERPPAFHAARSLFHYQHTGECLVLLLKYGNGAWVLPEIRRLVEEGLPAEAYRGHRIVPVPLHPSRRRSRGYNQAEVVARALASVFPEAAVEFPLVRVRRTSSQTTLTREQRGRNVAGAFALRRGLPAVTPGPYLLVDDVLTTGATLHAAASVLRRAGATTISAFTLAHG